MTAKIKMVTNNSPFVSILPLMVESLQIEYISRAIAMAMDLCYPNRILQDSPQMACYLECNCYSGSEQPLHY